jgi:hypothetical protein
MLAFLISHLGPFFIASFATQHSTHNQKMPKKSSSSDTDSIATKATTATMTTRSRSRLQTRTTVTTSTTTIEDREVAVTATAVASAHKKKAAPPKSKPTPNSNSKAPSTSTSTPVLQLASFSDECADWQAQAADIMSDKFWKCIQAGESVRDLHAFFLDPANMQSYVNEMLVKQKRGYTISVPDNDEFRNSFTSNILLRLVEDKFSQMLKQLGLVEKKADEKERDAEDLRRKVETLESQLELQQGREEQLLQQVAELTAPMGQEKLLAGLEEQITEGVRLRSIEEGEEESTELQYPVTRQTPKKSTKNKLNELLNAVSGKKRKLTPDGIDSGSLSSKHLKKN